MRTNLRMALKALGQNKLQSVLTLLGMSVGVAMMVIVAGLGLGAQQRIESQIESAGPTRVTVRSGNYVPPSVDGTGQQDSGGGEWAEGTSSAEAGMEGSLALAGDDNAAVVDARRRIRAPKKTRFRSPAMPIGPADLESLRTIDGVKAIAGQRQGNASVDAAATLPVTSLRVSGFDPAWPDMTGWKLLEGRLPSEAEHRDAALVVLVSPAVTKRLWPDAPSPLNKVVPLGGQPLRVVGVVDASDDATGVVVPAVHVPNALAARLLGRSTFDTLTIRTSSIAVTSRVAKDAQAKLRQTHAIAADMVDDFRVETQSNSALPGGGVSPALARSVHSNSGEFERASWEEMAKSLRQAGRTFSLLLAGAAAVSLLVGGIGVMNIMLVSVAARTREIGLRMALGARAGDVRLQFLVEAATLAALGGLIGLGLGGLGLLVTEHGLHWATAVSPGAMALALGMAAVTGVVFGLGPAHRAADLDPVIALRSE